jgi:hypothetical protein
MGRFLRLKGRCAGSSARSQTLFRGDRLKPLLIAFFNDLVVVGDRARFAERLGLSFISRFNIVERADDELLHRFHSIDGQLVSPSIVSDSMPDLWVP